MNFRKSSCSKHYNDKYIPPYDRLLSRIRRWKPKQAAKEEQLQNLCKQGILTPFQQPQNYSCYFINSKTDIFMADKLIDEAKLTHHFSVDTENDVLTHRPATIQVEFIRPNSPPIVIIIEASYLPPTNCPLFRKIQHLCSIIFTSNNTIYSWGSPKEEVEKFSRFDLFNKSIQIIEKNVQNAYDPINQYGLQDVIEFDFKQYLNKTATVGEWGCGIDLLLGTHLPKHLVGPERTYYIQEERKYRSILKEYAINDVFAVTKLVHKMNLINLLTPPSTAEHQDNYEEPMQIQQEPSIELKPPNEEQEVHVQDEEPTTSNENSSYEEHIELEITPSDNNMGIFDFENVSNDDQDEIYYNQLRKVHVHDEPMELELYDNQTLPTIKKPSSFDDGWELISDDELPEVMKIHRPFKQLYHQEQQQPNETRTVHVTGEPHKVRNSYYLGPQLYLHENPTPNQIRNRRLRAKRYIHEVIREVYGAFRNTDIKDILHAINITYLNVNIVRGKLYIGLKNEQAVDEAEQVLHPRMFTKDHYQRYMKKKKKNTLART